MNVVFSIVGDIKPQQNRRLDMSVIPRVGETVQLPDVPMGLSVVRTVVWYPLGDPDEGEPDPFIYIVIGPGRP